MSNKSRQDSRPYQKTDVFTLSVAQNQNPSDRLSHDNHDPGGVTNPRVSRGNFKIIYFGFTDQKQAQTTVRFD